MSPSRTQVRRFPQACKDILHALGGQRPGCDQSLETDYSNTCQFHMASMTGNDEGLNKIGLADKVYMVKLTGFKLYSGQKNTNQLQSEPLMSKAVPSTH